MQYVTMHEKPSTETRYLLASFNGWPDAGEGASSAIRYLVRKLPAKKFAEIDSEDFYDFSHTRPHTSINSLGERVIKWPTNELYYWAGPDPSSSLMLFRGVEPNLKWRTFSRAIAEVAQASGVQTVIHMGALLDAVPHTREVPITGSSNGGDLKLSMEGYNIGSSNYQGPTGITSALMEACAEKGINFASMWGHTPHYLQAAPNYRVGYTLVSNLSRILGFQIPLDELRSAANTFDEEVEKAVSKDSQISAYVSKLESRYDETKELFHGEMPQTEDLVKDLEEFLKQQQRRNGEPGLG